MESMGPMASSSKAPHFTWYWTETSSCRSSLFAWSIFAEWQKHSLGRCYRKTSICIPFLSTTLSAMLRADIKLHRLRTGWIGKQIEERGKKVLQLDFGSYKLHRSKTCSLQWASLCYWEDFADVSSIHWGICSGMRQTDAFSWGVGNVLTVILENHRRAQWTLLRTFAVLNRPASTAAGTRRSQRTNVGSTVGS